jgi:transglutaminase-like putative cysteine protease
MTNTQNRHMNILIGRMIYLQALTLAGMLALPALAGTNDYTGARWALVDRAQVLAAANSITPDAYPDCDTATVEQHSVRVYRADGTGEAQDESFTKVLTEKGRRGNRTITLGFMLPYSAVAVPALEIIKPDGLVEPVDVTANSKETIDESQMSMNIYDPNSKVLQVNIPKLEIGDIVHAVTRTTTERPYIPGQYSEENVFEGGSYLRHLTYEVFAPAGRPLQEIALRDEIPGTVTYLAQTNADSSITYLWTVANVPRMFDEPAMPPYDNVLQRLYVSTMPDWQAVSKWYWDLSKSHLDATTPDMLRTVSNLTAGAASDLDKIKNVFYYVSKKVRYMGLTPEKDRPGFEPHDVCLTFGKNYGVCRDKAALLVAMLREAGLKSYPVLISVGSKRDPVVPDPGFNHAIAGVELEHGKYLLMDPTDENTRELLPSYDRDQSYLVCKPEGETLLISPVQSPDENLMRVKTTGTLSAAGVLDARTELSFEGVNDDAYRNAFVKMKPDDVRRFFERDLKQVLPGAKLKSLKLTPENLLDMATNVHAEIEFTAAGLTASGNGKAIVTLPWIGKCVGILNFILRDAGLEKRKYPMQTGTTGGLEEEVSLKLDGFDQALSLPEYPAVKDACLSSHEQVAFANDTLTATRKLTLNVVEFSPAQYATLKETLKQQDYDARKMPVLTLKNAATAAPEENAAAKNAPVQSDAVILSASKQLDVTDAHASVYRVKYSKRILSYEGKKRESELKIDFNPSCQNAKLVSAATISHTGERTEISPGEINVMDAGWNASAKRYTGGKILVANLPNVDLGSTIEVEFEITFTNRPFLAGFETFQFPDELKAKSVELTAPAGVKIEKRLSGPAGSVKETVGGEAGRQAFSWTAENVRALPSERQLPPDWTFNPGVSYFIGDVNDYYRALEQALMDRAGKNTQAAARAHQLTAAAASQLESLKIIRDFVVKSIRLAGPSFTDLPLTELSAADTTLADGYGHAADRAILLHAMLAAAGFKPEFVLASDLPPVASISDIARKFPLPQNFQYPLVRVVVDGQAYYLNDTDQYAQPGSTAHADRLALALASQSFETIRAAKNCDEKSETLYTVALNHEGQAQIGVTRRYFGSEFNEKNRYFSELPPEERRRYFQEIVTGVAQGARPVGDLVTKFDTYPGTEQFQVTVDNYAVVDGKYLYFDLPFTPSLIPVGTDARELPLFIAARDRNTIRAEITLPPEFRKLVIAPAGKKLSAANGGTAQIITSSDNGKFVLTDELETTPAIIDAADYPAVLKTESALRQKSARAFLLQAE